MTSAIGSRHSGEVSSHPDPSEAVKMTVRGLVMDPTSNSPVVILQNSDGTAFLPIWIGVCEANSIALVLEGVESPRPMTHDLVHNLLDTAGCAVEHIFIHSLDDSIFIASIQLRDADLRPIRWILAPRTPLPWPCGPGRMCSSILQFWRGRPERNRYRGHHPHHPRTNAARRHGRIRDVTGIARSFGRVDT